MLFSFFEKLRYCIHTLKHLNLKYTAQLFSVCVYTCGNTTQTRHKTFPDSQKASWCPFSVNMLQRQPLFFDHHKLVLPVLELYVNGIIIVFFCAQLSLIMTVRFIHAVAQNVSLLFFIV